MRIAEVSKRYGVSSDTLRYYERIGLLRHVPRTSSGVRDYEESDCARIEFVKCMRDAGIPIEPLIEYIRLYEQGDSTSEQRKALLVEQRALMQQRIDSMQAGLDRLDAKIASYDTIIASREHDMRAAELADGR